MKRILETLKRKWPEYLLEIFVITIGILVAFALNNWNDERHDKRQETQYLLALNEDILRLKSELEITRLDLLKIEMACDSLIRSIHKPLSNPNNIKLNSLTGAMVTIPGLKLSFPSYDNLKSTSDLNKIESDQLKLSLSNIELALTRLDRSIDWQDKQWTSINQVYINKKMDLTEISNSEGDEDYRINIESIFENDWKKILRDREFSNIVVNRKWAVIDVLNSQIHLKNMLDKCQQIIQQELDN